MRLDFCRIDSRLMAPLSIAMVMFAILAVFAELRAQEVPAIIAPNAATTTEYNSQTIPAPLNPVADSNLHSAGDGRNEFSSEPRRFQYALQIGIRGVYDDNVDISDSHRVSDYYFTIEPQLTLGFGNISGREGNYLRFDYLPALSLFVDHSEDDSFQNVINLQGQHAFARLTVTMGEEIAILDGTDLRSLSNQTTPGSQPNLDVATRTKFQTYTTRFNASYDLSGKTFLSSGFDSLVTDYSSSTLFSSGDVAGNLFLNYRYSDKVIVGVGGTGGYNFVQEPNPDETFEQANARLTYQASGKISLDFSGGVEFRQFQNNSRGTYVSPVFELTANYELSDATKIALTGTRRTYNSALGGQDFAETNITASLRQRFLQRFYLAVAGGYADSDYFNTISTVLANRTDNYYFIEPAIDFSITRFWTFGAYYLHRQNDSSAQSFGFDDNQVGLRTALVF